MRMYAAVRFFQYAGCRKIYDTSIPNGMVLKANTPGL